MPTSKQSSTRTSRASTGRTAGTSSRSGSTTSRSGSSSSRSTPTGTRSGSTSTRSATRPRSTPRAETRGSTRSQDAISLLQQDHRKVQQLFKQAEKLDREEDAEELQQIVATACEELTLHTEIEEDLVYPAIAEAVDEDDQDLVREALIEHQSAKELIAQLEQSSPSDENYQACFTVLGEYVNHHIKEEEGEIFPKAKKAKVDLEGLGQAILQRKQAAGKAEGEEETPE